MTDRRSTRLIIDGHLGSLPPCQAVTPGGHSPPAPAGAPFAIGVNPPAPLREYMPVAAAASVAHASSDTLAALGDEGRRTMMGMGHKGLAGHQHSFRAAEHASGWSRASATPPGPAADPPLAAHRSPHHSVIGHG